MGRLTDIWGHDAKKFNPDRWLNPDGSLKKVTAYKWPVFHAGPRTCLGQGLATQEAGKTENLKAVTVLSILVRKFKFEAVPGQRITYGDTLTLPMLNGFRVFAGAGEK